MNRRENNLHWTAYVSPAGALFALVCFFLPWAKVTCAGVRRSVSGAQLGGLYWLLVPAALMIIAAFLNSVLRRGGCRSWWLVALSALAGLMVLLTKFLEDSPRVWGLISAKKLGLTIQFGAIGTPLGFLFALVGSLMLRRSRRAAGWGSRTVENDDS